MNVKELPAYEVPEVISYTDEELLEEIGPAQAQTYGGPPPPPPPPPPSP